MFHSIALARLMIAVMVMVVASPLFAEEQKLTERTEVKEAINLLEIWLESEMSYKRIPGLSAAIVFDQELLWTKALGYANPDKNVPTEPETIYSICSISKLFTSIAIMQLRDAGKLKLDDPLAKHLPWFDIKKSDPKAPPITIRSVLRHSSGLPRESEQPYVGEPDLPWPEREKMINKLPDQETIYSTDVYFQYSNLGISLLGEVVAAVSGKSYNDYIRDHILDPLGMNSTTTYLPEKDYGYGLAIGFSRWPREGTREQLPFFQAQGVAPAAGFASTVVDMSKFASWQFRAIANADDPVLNGYTLKEMHRVHWVDPDWQTRWGLGFATWREKNVTFVGHGGGCPGYRTHIALSPKDKIAVIFMTNATDINPGRFTQQGYNIIAPAITSSKEDGKKLPVEFEKFTGLYQTHWGEIAVFAWKGSLATMFLPSDSPADSITELKHAENNVFRRVRKDGNPGERVIFELDADGNVQWYKSFSFYMKKIR